jgi:hypothetical protein
MNISGLISVKVSETISIKPAGIYITVHREAEIQEYIGTKRIEAQLRMKELSSESARTSTKTNPIRKIELARKKVNLFMRFFDSFDASNAIAIGQTSENGEFEIDLPDLKSEAISLFATLNIKLGEEERVFVWILDCSHVVSPVLLTDTNQFKINIP